MIRTRALLAALLFAPLLLAQDAPPTADDLAAQQRRVGERLAKIEETMRRVAKIIEKDNPEQAARLKMAWDRSKSDRNLEKIGEIEDLLEEEYFNEAFDEQKKLEAALNRLLDILLDREAELNDLKDEIDRLESLAQKLDKIIEDERRQYHNTEKFADPEKTLQRAAAAKAKLTDLIAREGKLIDKTKRPGRNEALEALKARAQGLLHDQQALRGKQDAAAQDELKKKADALAEDIARHAKSLPDAMKAGKLGRSDPAGQAAGASERAAGAMGEAAAKMKGDGEFQPNQRDAEQELSETLDALRRLEKRREKYDESRLVKEQDRIRKDTERLQAELDRLEKNAPGTDSGSGNLGKAQGDMNRASGKLSRGERRDAVPHEEDAKRELEKAYEKLEELEKELKRLIELPDYDKLAEEQEKTEGDTEDLLKDMKKAGDPQGGGQGEGTPGQGGVQGAKRAMQRAKRNLRQRSAKGANRDQKEALERLEKAREELEEALRQMREEEQLMLLEAIERRLRRMLRDQTKIFKETLSLSIRLRDAKKPPRAVVDKGAQLGDGEAELAAEAEKILEILREEGTTVVIPDVVEDLKLDLDNLARRLRDLKAGPYTQQVQRDVMETLRDLIEVIQQELNRRQGQGQGGQPQEGNPDEPLLPTSAELKMLKALQLRVNRRTETFEKLIEKEDDERSRIADKQSAVGTLTRTMADRLNREEDQ